MIGKELLVRVQNTPIGENTFDFKGTDAEMKEVYDFLRTSVLDGLIPIPKAIGFKIVDSKFTSNANAIARHEAILENMIALSANVSKLIFGIDTGRIVNIKEAQGVITTENAIMTCGERKDKCELVNKNTYLYSSYRDVGIRICTGWGKGVVTMEENVANMKATFNQSVVDVDTFFPLNTEFSLIDYIKILPFMPGDKTIKFRIVKDANRDCIVKILQNYFIECANFS